MPDDTRGRVARLWPWQVKAPELPRRRQGEDGTRYRIAPAIAPVEEQLHATAAYPNREQLAWAGLLVVAALSRIVGLGQRAISYDESLHAVYAWRLYQGLGYQHQPLMHGPLKFELTALVYLVLGATDGTSRLITALFGIGMVWLVWLMRPWLGKTGAFLAATMFAISPALLFYSRYLRDEIIIAAFSVALVVSLFRYFETRAGRWLYAVAVLLALAFATMEMAFILGGFFGFFLVLDTVARIWPWDWPALRTPKPRPRLDDLPQVDLIVLLGTLALPYLSGVIFKVLGWTPDQFNTAAGLTPAMLLQAFLVLLGLFVLSGLIGWAWLRERWLVAAGLFWFIDITLFTTFFANGPGIITGVVGSVGYWIDQQGVMRGAQPWYYFLLLVPLYEFLPLVLSIAAGLTWLVARFRRNSVRTAAGPENELQPLFVTFLVYWVASTWLALTFVGEKMPWHVVYFATPMALLGGWWLGRVVDGTDWRVVWERGGLWLMGTLPLFLIAARAVLPTSTWGPFRSIALQGLRDTEDWLLALFTAAGLAYVLYGRARHLGWPLTRRLVGLTLIGLLALGTIVVAYRLAFVNYDYATEPLVYAHGTPDLKLATAQIAEISRKTAGDLSVRVAYDEDTAWPLEWYLRDYTNRVYYGSAPSAALLDAPVVIAGDQDRAAVLPYLGNRYYEFNYRLIWWPRETYKNLTWQRIWDGLRDPVQRGGFWNVVLFRRYTTPTAEWEPAHRFSLFVRKDVAAQIWDWAGGP
jgi:uncharacterized protein (TIGR03663 family)